MCLACWCRRDHAAKAFVEELAAEIRKFLHRLVHVERERQAISRHEQFAPVSPLAVAAEALKAMNDAFLRLRRARAATAEEAKLFATPYEKASPELPELPE
jgi:hypothetical protein